MKNMQVLVLLLLCASCAFSQTTTTPDWEIQGGYQFTRLDISAVQNAANQGTAALGIPPVSVGNTLNMNGFDLSVQENGNNWFSFLADFSGSYAKKSFDLSAQAAALGLATPVTANFSPKFYTITVGPQFTYRKSKIQPFGRVLLGVAVLDLSPDTNTQAALTALSPTFKTTNNAFAADAGGGVDVEFRKNIQLRF